MGKFGNETRIEKVVEEMWNAVFSVDPGVTTGWSWAMVRNETLFGFGEGGKGRAGNAVRAVFEARESGLLEGGQLNFGGDENQIVERLGVLIGGAENRSRLVANGEDVSITLLSEDFVVGSFNSSRSFLAPVRINAKLDWLVWKRSIRVDHFASYLAANAKTTCSDSRMKSWGLYSNMPHELDSLRHLVLHLRRLSSGEVNA